MKVVVDANVICSGLLSKGKTADLLFSDKLHPIAPEFLFAEIDKHSGELMSKSKLSENDFKELLGLFKHRIRIVRVQEFSHKLREANEMLGSHVKDTEYVALSLAFNCPLWSKEKRLKKLAGVEVLDANEVESRIKAI